MSQLPPGARRTAARGRRPRVCLRDYWAEPARALLVEDDPSAAEMIGIVLAAQGVRSHWSGTGRDAVAEFARLRPHLVLLDLRLPDTSGVEVCRRIRSVSATPIVVVSATRDPQLLAAAMSAGADDRLPKPFSIDDLAGCLDTHIPASNPPGLVSLSTDAEAMPTGSPIAPRAREHHLTLTRQHGLDRL